MNYRYKNLSCGYTGNAHHDATLNSQFFHLFFETIKKSANAIHEIIVFPQRVPRKDFFDEIYELETQKYKYHLDSIIQQITHNHIQSLNALIKSNNKKCARQYLNWSNILLRYGQFENIIMHFPEHYSGHYSLEIALIKETAEIEINLSQAKPISINNLLKLAVKYLSDPNSEDREKIKLLNQIIVYYYRHDKNTNLQTGVFNLSMTLLDYVKKFENSNFINTYYCSIGYRGLAMVAELEPALRTELLEKSLQLARDLQPNTDIEKVVSSDNLFTCLQSIAKWNLANGNSSQAKSNLKELLSIDPHDSTGFSELGFYYADKNAYELAVNHFESAMKLGAPGTGMNTYYYAKCLEKLGNQKDAIYFLRQAAKIDDQALSPWLDLLTLYSINNMTNKAKHVARYILNNPTMMEQLEEDEINDIQTIIT